jgi:hypothetical protein
MMMRMINLGHKCKRGTVWEAVTRRGEGEGAGE